MSEQSFSSSFKGFNSILKGIVTRSNEEDPLKINRIQVCIPSYHGKVDQSKVGTGDNPGSYPWAQICSIRFKSSDGKGLFASFFGGDKDGTQDMQYPEVNDVVWLAFEGGDIRCPIYLGSISKEAAELAGEYADLIAGGGLASMASSIIFAEEGGYTSINGNDNGAISIGKIQWHADNARNLLIKIREKNFTKFDNLCDDNNAPDLIDKLNESWSSFIAGKGTDYYKAISAILNTPEAKEAQDESAMEYVQRYIDDGKKRGITDYGALIYWADLQNQGGYGGASKCYEAASKPVTLDSLHSGAMSTYMGNYPSRRNRVYNKIKELESQGKLEEANLTTDVNSINLGGQYLWPVPHTQNITSKYGPRTLAGINDGGFHYGIDIAGGGDLGKPVVAVDDGVVAKISNNEYGEGNCIFIQLNKNKNHYATYMHLCEKPDVKPGLHVGDTVKAGQVVGYLGSTGQSTGPHLHFGLHVGSPWGKRTTSGRLDPLPYLKRS